MELDKGQTSCVIVHAWHATSPRLLASTCLLDMASGDRQQYAVTCVNSIVGMGEIEEQEHA